MKAMVKLENQLKEKIGGNAPAELFKLPFARTGNLGKVHPERLVQQLANAGAITIVENSKFVQDHITR